MNERPKAGSNTAEAETFRGQFLKRLDRLAKKGRTVALWWRDDDAVAPTPALERMTLIAEKYRVPLVLAVIPEGASEALARYVADHPLLVPTQHGWAHADHADREAGQKAAEFGANRPAEESLADLKRGVARMGELFGERFVPVLTPPWNRISEDVIARRSGVGLAGLSLFGPNEDGPPLVNTHVDVIAWKKDRKFIGRARAYYLLVEELDRRLKGSTEPLGLLTHHLVHDRATWVFLDELLAEIAHHPGIVWPEPRQMFGV